MPAQRDPLITALRNPALYDHPVVCVRVVETHASWVVLTGPVAYKIKKPVDLGFLDFTTLPRRKHFCEEELRLNQRLASDLYLGIVSISGTRQQPVLGGPGEPIEYAVKMRQFDDRLQLDRMLGRHTPDEKQILDEAQIAHFAAELAAFHRQVAVAGPGSAYGGYDSLRGRVLDNFCATRACADQALCANALTRLLAWSEDSLKAHRALFSRRLHGGFVRECHGDLHLANLVLLDDRISAFDCLEFSPALRWIDVISELAFLHMDLDYRRHGNLASVFLNRYLEHTGDYEGIALLRHYLVYRAMVRAKVACIRFRQDPQPDELQAVRRHVRLAQRYARHHRPAIVLTFGLSGSGKTYLTDRLLGRAGVVRVRSDVERKRLYGLPALAVTGSGHGTSIYGPEANARTYARLREVAEMIVGAGYTVIIDAAFLKRRERSDVYQLARRLRVPVAVLALEAEPDALRRRIVQRLRHGSDASEATPEILQRQRAALEPLSAAERMRAVIVHSTRSADPAGIARDVERTLTEQHT